ncbi:hypothetical protein [Streptomyces sp. NPDC059215]|uniref:hypothetical protein n=1 Tax=Streptomyces sp. NPDC059215 TaxID=3346772 RepID=UPI0036C73C32
MSNDPLALVTQVAAAAVTADSGKADKWLQIFPPKEVRVRWMNNFKAFQRPPGTLAVPAIATTAGLEFTHHLHHGDTVMALGLTALAVGYDAVIMVCRTWIKISRPEAADAEATPSAKTLRAA